MSLEVRRTAAPSFVSPQNQNLLCQVLTNDFSSRGLGALSRDESSRLPRMVKHYVTEVARVKGESGPVTLLNKEVLKACATQIITGRREVEEASQIASAGRSASPEDEETDIVAALGMGGQQQLDKAPEALFQDTSRRFEMLQQQRNDLVKRDTPAPPDFRVSLEEDKQLDAPIKMFEAAKAARDREMAAADAAALQTVGPLGDVRPRMPERDPALIIKNVERPLPQDNLIRKDDVLTYKENEFNLFVNSIDRNWYQDSGTRFNETKQNRYNFVVNFDPANNRQGLGITPASQRKFRNIVRIELVKVIMPAEPIETVVTVATGPVYTTNLGITPLTLPYVIVHVDELEGNNYGTNNDIDNAFALIHYDGKWGGDHSAPVVTPGFIGMIPKFMKAQRIYSPTPLATLQKLTVNLQRPDGSPVSPTQDTFDLTKIYVNSALPGTNVAAAGNLFPTALSGDQYIFLQVFGGFDASAFSVGDRVNLQGVAVAGVGTAAQCQTFNDWVNRTEGHVVVAIQYINTVPAPDEITNGYPANALASTLVIQTQRSSTGIYPDFSSNSFNTGLAALNISNTRLINASRQVQCVFRVITRELDSQSRVRADNL
jgi:hypothetical protein